MSRAVTMAGWDDVPHLDADEKATMLAALLPHQKDARSKGIPALGSGAIYPVPIEDVFIDPIQLPAFYPRLYGLDVGWNCTAAIWGAWDRDNDIIYAYSEHYRGHAEPAVHSAAIKARGDWIPGEIDPAARGRSQSDGKKLITSYKKNGLILTPAYNAVEAGILEVYQRLSEGRLKIFNTLVKTKKEYQLYRRDEKGLIVKKNDHAMDALRYLVMGISHAIVKPLPQHQVDPYRPADRETGY